MFQITLPQLLCEWCQTLLSIVSMYCETSVGCVSLSILDKVSAFCTQKILTNVFIYKLHFTAYYINKELLFKTAVFFATHYISFTMTDP